MEKGPNLRRIFIFDNPRTWSHLFAKLFAQQPALQLLYHPFLPAALYGPERYQVKTKHCQEADDVQRYWGESEEFREWNVITYEAAFQKLMEATEGAEAEVVGKSIFCNEHLNALMRHDVMLDYLKPDMKMVGTTDYNPTCLPDDFLATLTPIVLIRHPALTIPSSWRTESNIKKLQIEDEDFWLLTTYKWSRLLFDHLHRNSAEGPAPVVVDAYDVVHNTDKLASMLCKKFDLDLQAVQQTWEKLPKEQWPDHSVVVGYTKDLLASNGVQRGSGVPLEDAFDIDAETVKWTAEFGPETALKMKKCVEAEMSDYEYLRSFKVAI
ncbi:hypothetical protein B0A50_05655 [Salinomyces thailandicus]|uniref:Uncharacterized protein n=1 Tax=Salinomyces thailandicus TaxID=706561 RepID=A0A4U0TUE1_9PEZI|nr:hypothetical protein B0A50_05655 [Salinomyces thailandica]